MNQDSETAEHFRVLKELASYLWPKDRLDLRVRVVLAMMALAAGKGVNVLVPYLLKKTIDELPRIAANGFSVALSLIVSYSVARILAQAFGELRDFIFARVSQHTQRSIGLTTFKHLHALSLAFHARSHEKGRPSVERAESKPFSRSCSSISCRPFSK